MKPHGTQRHGGSDTQSSGLAQCLLRGKAFGEKRDRVPGLPVVRPLTLCEDAACESLAMTPDGEPHPLDLHHVHPDTENHVTEPAVSAITAR